MRGVSPFTRAALENALGNGTAALTLLGVPPGNGVRFAIDRDSDGIANANEPLPALNVTFSGGVAQLAWPAAQSALVLEYTDAIESPNWQPVLAPSSGQRQSGPRLRSWRERETLLPPAGSIKERRQPASSRRIP